ncbi:MAG: hypothetical protein ACJ77B_01375 [Chloroflexota bacterium]|jgi:hypothetical protein
MQLITPRSGMRTPAHRSIVIGTLVGAVLLVGGLCIGWLSLATPFISHFMPTGRAGTSQMLMGMLTWAFALIAPATFIIVGLARIVTVVDSVASSRPRQTPASRLARSLGDEYVVASRVRLPDGRMVPDLVIGPFGAAVLEELPPSGVSRRHATGWEVRTREGRWIALENPLERAARDADRVRRWFAQDDQDFVVKVYAAVIAKDASVPRTATCAVITPEQIAPWLASLPAQRSLNEGRRQRLVDLIRDIA